MLKLPELVTAACPEARTEELQLVD